MAENNKKKKTKKINNRFLSTLILTSCIAVPAVGIYFGVDAIVDNCKKYTASFECNGVDSNWLTNHPFEVAPKEYSHAKKIALEDPKIPGYTFCGWKLKGHESEGYVIADKKGLYCPKKIYDDIVLTAYFEPILYIANFYLNGGELQGLVNKKYENHVYTFVEEGMCRTTFICTDEPFKFPSVKRNGYDLKNAMWEGEGSNYVEGCIPAETLNDITLTAKWEVRPYTINYEFEGPCVSEFVNEIVNNNSRSSNIEKEVVLSSPGLKGYKFEGWYDKDGKKIDKIPEGTYSETDIVNVTGKFSPITYNITYFDHTKSNHDVLPKTFTRASDDITIPDLNPRGYTFLGWLSDQSETLTHVNKIEHGSYGDISFTCDYSINTYKITFDVTGVADEYKSNFSLANTVINYTVESDDIEISTPSCTGYDFVKYVDATGADYTDLTIETGSVVGDFCLTAVFKPHEYKITRSYNVNTKGKDTVEVDKYTIESEPFEIVTPESTKKEFIAWEEPISKKLYYKGDKFGGGMHEDISLNATWKLFGDGDEEKPFEIYDEVQLANISDMNKHYILMNDIQILATQDEMWTPVGTQLSQFNGTFDGNNKTIEMITSGGCSQTYFGIFGYCAGNSVIKNLKVTGSIGADDNRFMVDLFGTIAAKTAGTIENCDCCLRSYLTSAGNAKIGGIAGECDGFINNCTYGLENGVVKGIIDFVSETKNVTSGGIAGYGSGGEIANCIMYCNLISKGNSESLAGGILGSRDQNNTTRLRWDDEETINQVVTGSISSFTKLENGKGADSTFRTDAYPSTNKRALGYSAYDSSTTDLNPHGRIVGSYYYCCGPTQNPIYVWMAWCKWAENDKIVDGSNFNTVVYSKYEK